MYENVEFKVCECAISNKDEVKVGHTYALIQDVLYGPDAWVIGTGETGPVAICCRYENGWYYPYDELMANGVDGSTCFWPRSIFQFADLISKEFADIAPHNWEG